VHRGDALYNHVNTLRVRALPGNLPSEIRIDVSILDTFDKSIHIGDIKLAGATIIGNANDLVVGLAQTGRGDAGAAATPAAEPELVRSREAKA
jgi:hypothetical protein